jgi:hypothetical protein
VTSGANICFCSSQLTKEGGRSEISSTRGRKGTWQIELPRLNAPPLGVELSKGAQ